MAAQPPVKIPLPPGCTSSIANAINSNGDVVRWKLQGANDVNDGGMVVGLGLFLGQTVGSWDLCTCLHNPLRGDSERLLAGDQTRLCCHNSTPPLTAFACQGLSAARRQRIDSAVEAAGQRPASPYEAWIAADPSPGGVRVLITGPRGFERKVAFAVGRSAGPERIVRSAARRRRAAAQRKRWVAARKAKAAATPTPAKAARKKRRLSPEGRARIVVATKRRWAAVRKPKPAKTAAAKLGLKRAARTIVAKNPTPTVAPWKAAIRTKAAPRRPSRNAT